MHPCRAAAESLAAILLGVSRVFEDFRYEREIGADGGRDHALVFNTRIFDREAQGCDFLHTDENGLIDEFTVMVRPLSAALALAEAMKVQLEAAPRDQRHAGVLVARGSATRANQTRGWMERRVRRGRAATSVEPPARPAPGRRPSTSPRGRRHMKAESRSGRGLRADYWSVRNGAARRCRRLAAAPRQERSCARRRPGRCFWCRGATMPTPIQATSASPTGHDGSRPSPSLLAGDGEGRGRTDALPLDAYCSHPGVTTASHGELRPD
jgi:hypothetical protein